jgi:hypothetical protein
MLRCQVTKIPSGRAIASVNAITKRACALALRFTPHR